jgi:beta-galactosidase
VLRFYRALRRAGVSLDIVPPTAEAVAGRKLVLMPGLFAVPDDFAAALAASGAVLLAGPRTGSKTAEFKIPSNLPPGPLGELFGVRVRRVESLRPGIAVPVAGSNTGAACDGWYEHLTATSAALPLLSAPDGGAILSTQGRAYYLAGRPNPVLADDVVSRLLTAAGLDALPLHRDLRIRDHGPRRFAFNHGPDAIDIASLRADAPLELGTDLLPSCGVAAWRRR